MILALADNASLTALDLSRNYLGAAGGIATAKMLATNTTLTFLNLEINELGPKAATAIGNSLVQNSTLRSLYLGARDEGCNRLCDEAAIGLAKGLKHNSSLTLLDFVGGGGDCPICEEYNNIGDKGASAQANAILHNSTLTQLDLGGHEVSDEGALALWRALQLNTFVTSLSLKGNSIKLTGDFMRLACNTLRATPVSSLFERFSFDAKSPGKRWGKYGMGIMWETMKLPRIVSKWSNKAVVGFVRGDMHKAAAFVMGLHTRLGCGSRVGTLDGLTVQKIVETAYTYAPDDGVLLVRQLEKKKRDKREEKRKESESKETPGLRQHVANLTECLEGMAKAHVQLHDTLAQNGLTYHEAMLLQKQQLGEDTVEDEMEEDEMEEEDEEEVEEVEDEEDEDEENDDDE